MRALSIILAGALVAAPLMSLAAPPTEATRAALAKAAQAPEFADRADYADADRGFLGTRADPVIRTAAGAVAFDLAAYDFLKAEAAGTVHPALWRQSQLLARHGLYQVVDGIYQVRGFDLANMTFVRSRTGWIVIDTLGSIETAKAALDLANEKLGTRPVIAVIYTHSHADHMNGTAGVVTAADVAAGRVRVIAPTGFMEAVTSENVIAGPAMQRRAVYQFGNNLPRSAEGQVSAGIGPGLSRGTTGLIPPNVLVTADNRNMTVDGVRLEFQLTPETEAPAEMNIYLPDFRALDMAENANTTMHNVLTPRGALVRDSKAWADYLTAAIRQFGPKTDVMLMSHAWPRFGQARVVEMLEKHRDAYKFVHDQSVRLMNQGLTGQEIADRLVLPQALAREWYNHGFYGTVSFNARAVYQRYMGWYDGNPASLAPMPPEKASARYVEAMGGQAAVLQRARAAFAAGDYAWAAELLDKAVFAAPTEAAPRELLAQTYEQLGYQAESSTWRNMYLTAAGELRTPVRPAAAASGAGPLTAASLGFVLDTLAVRLDPGRAGEGKVSLAVVQTDTQERAHLRVANGVLVHETGAPMGPVDATVTASRADLAALLGGGPAPAGARVDGDRAAVERLISWMDRPSANFAIVTP